MTRRSPRGWQGAIAMLATRIRSRSIFAALIAVATAFATAVLLAPTASAAPARDTEATVTGATQADGLNLHITGSGYTDLPAASTGAPAAGIYIALRDANTMPNDAINDNTDLAPASTFLPRTGTGNWATDLNAPATSLTPDADYEIIVWVAHGQITTDTLLATEPITLTEQQRAALFPSDEPEDPDTPEASPSSTTTSTPAQLTPAPPAKPARTTTSSPAPSDTLTCTSVTIPATAGTPHLSWGVKSAFVNYVQGSIAQGKVTTGDGAARTSSGFTWGAGSGSLDGSGSGTFSFPGTVGFTGHQGALNLTLSGLRVTTTASGDGTLTADVRSTDMSGNDASANDVVLARVHFTGLSEDGGRATVTLTGAGATAFADFYSAGEQLDPLTISITGATAAHTENRCYDSEGNLVGPNGADIDALAATGTSAASTIGVGAALTLAGALLLLALRRRPATHR